MARLLRRAVGAAYAASLAPAAYRFQRAVGDPGEAQRRRLRGFLRANADTAYGRAHAFSRIDSVAGFQDGVPVVDFEALAPWIARIERGEPRVLTAAPVRMFERSGGSSGRTKLVPYTDALLAEFAAATGPWLSSLFRARPGLCGGASYWSLSPVAQGRECTEGGVPIGFSDDTEYFGRVSRWALRRLMAVPPEVAAIPDVAAWRRETARHLLAERDLVLVSVWSPTFLTLMMETLETGLAELLEEVPRARAREVRAALSRPGHGLGEALWPRLELVSCWTDGPSAAFLAGLRRHFPTTWVQGKGLLATEGVVSVPIVGTAAPVAAVAGHFLEFLDVEHPSRRALLVEELQVGGRYSPLLTTGGGLARYHLKDVVACVGRFGRAPLLRFEGRFDQVADLVGEKIAPPQAEAALVGALQDAGLRPRFAMLAPSLASGAHYRLYLEAEAPAEVLGLLGERVEATLSAAHPYRYCRQLGQLGALRIVRVRGGARAYEGALAARGQRLGSIKPALLDPRPIWDGVFEVAQEPRA